MSHREPISRNVSSAGSTVSVPTPLRHPTPDLQTLRGAYVQNIQKLEQSAEELSAIGSDLGEEIRKMNELSRQSSIQSSHHGEISVVRHDAFDRMSSSSSTRRTSSRRSQGSSQYFRATGQHQYGYVTSPLSPTLLQSPLHRVTSAPQTSNNFHGGHPMSLPLHNEFNSSEEADLSRMSSVSSYSARYNEIAGQIEDALQHVPPSPPKHATQRGAESVSQRDGSGGTIVPRERPRSTDTFLEAQTAFMDFDGVHFSPETNEYIQTDLDGNEIRRTSAGSFMSRLSAQSATLQPRNAQPINRGVPPPGEDMVYYPVPVPKVLNLPKRLSQLPAATVQSKRRSQMLAQLSRDAGEAAPWLSPSNATNAKHVRNGSSSSLNPAKPDLGNRLNSSAATLPAHARAELFFTQQPVQHDIQLQSGSAVATLDSILAASATAPVDSFIDHPYVGDVRKSVYHSEQDSNQSTKPTLAGTRKNSRLRKSRKSDDGANILRRALSSDHVATLLKSGDRQSSYSNEPDISQGEEALRRPRSRLSLGVELETFETSNEQDGASPANETELLDGQERIAEEGECEAYPGEVVEEGQGDSLEGDPTYVKPSTLLAELQVRKAQQKSRSRTAATAFPNGMHSTLLELDAVEEMAKRKRKGQQVALAWEDPQQRALLNDKEQEEEDVPLGVLYPSKEGLINRRFGDDRDWQRPLGLMDRRAFEDGETLSSRRSRLTRGRPSKSAQLNAMHASVTPFDRSNPGQTRNTDENEEETLAQRLQRLKHNDPSNAQTDIEATASANTNPSFTTEVLDQLHVLGFGPTPTSEGRRNRESHDQPALDVEEETLGQRRARLQREREARSKQRGPSNSYEPTQGSLLSANAQVEAKQKLELQSANLRASSYHLDKPLVNIEGATQSATNGLLTTGQSRAPSGGFALGMYNNGMGGIQLQSTPPAPMHVLSGGSPYSSTVVHQGSYAYQSPVGYSQTQRSAPGLNSMQTQQTYNMHAYAALTGAAWSPLMPSNGFMGKSYNMGGTNAEDAHPSVSGGTPSTLTINEGISKTERAVLNWRSHVL